MAVLIVCGDAAAMDRLARSLEDDGHLVVTAASGRRALDVLKCNQNIRTVVVDRRIPDMSPFDLFQAYNAYRELQWPGCETRRGNPAFILSQSLQVEGARSDLLNAVSDISSNRAHRSSLETACEPAGAVL